MTRFLGIPIAALMLLATGAAAQAQSAVTGAIGGTVTDPNNAVLPNAAVNTRNVETNKEAVVMTDGEGRYRNMKLVLLAEAFNLFNRTQVTAVNTRLYIMGGTAAASTLTFDPSFQTVSGAGSALARERQIQLGVRFEF